MGQDTTEPWNVWYPKARAAYQQLKHDSLNEDIRKLYKDVGDIPPDRNLYVENDLASFDPETIELAENCVFETLRCAKYLPLYWKALTVRQSSPVFNFWN